VLGGSNGVLSTEIFFAVVGSQNDPSRAAVLATVLLLFTLSAFLAQRVWLSGRTTPPSPARATADRILLCRAGCRSAFTPSSSRGFSSRSSSTA
jgi:ABC-type Fe3+ transport system permease subunit